MTGALLTDINTDQRYTETFHAAQGVEQIAVGNNTHATRLKGLVASVERLPQFFVLRQQTLWFWYFFTFQARFQPCLCRHQAGTQVFHQIAIRFCGTFFADQRQQFRSCFNHRQFRNQNLNIFQEQIGGFPAAEQQDVAGDIGSDVRVAVAVTAHPRGKTYRNKFDGQFVAEILFQLFVQFAQVIRYALPQAVFYYGKAPFGLIYRAWAQLTDFIGMP